MIRESVTRTLTAALAMAVVTLAACSNESGSSSDSSGGGGTTPTGPSHPPEPASSDTTVAKEPCRDHTGQPVGPSVHDLVTALRHQPVFTVSPPRRAAVDGARGVTVEVRIPPRFNAADCFEGNVHFWSSGPDGWANEPGYVARWWILNVPGTEDIGDTRVVVIEKCDVTCNDETVETLAAMGDSMTFRHG